MSRTLKDHVLKQKGFAVKRGQPERNAVAAWLVRSTPEREIRIRALAGNIVLCS